MYFFDNQSIVGNIISTFMIFMTLLVIIDTLKWLLRNEYWHSYVSEKLAYVHFLGRESQYCQNYKIFISDVGKGMKLIMFLNSNALIEFHIFESDFILTLWSKEYFCIVFHCVFVNFGCFCLELGFSDVWESSYKCFFTKKLKSESWLCRL